MTTTRIPVTGSRPEDEYEVLVGRGLKIGRAHV